MAGNIQIPVGVEKVVMVEVKDTSELLRRFLIDITNKVETLEDRITELEDRVATLESS